MLLLLLFVALFIFITAFLSSGDGFSLTNYNGEEMLGIINYAKHIYFDFKKDWNKMIDRGMANDYSWNSSKYKYENLYNYLIG